MNDTFHNYERKPQKPHYPAPLHLAADFTALESPMNVWLIKTKVLHQHAPTQHLAPSPRKIRTCTSVTNENNAFSAWTAMHDNAWHVVACGAWSDVISCFVLCGYMGVWSVGGCACVERAKTRIHSQRDMLVRGTRSTECIVSMLVCPRLLCPWETSLFRNNRNQLIGFGHDQVTKSECNAVQLLQGASCTKNKEEAVESENQMSRLTLDNSQDKATKSTKIFF